MTDQENLQETVKPTAGPAITDFTESQNLNRLAMLHISTPPSPTAEPESTSSAERRKASSSAKRRSPSTPSSSSGPHQHHHRVRGYRRFKLPTSATASNNSGSPAGNSSTPEMTDKILHAPANCPASAKSTTIAAVNALLPPRPISRAATAPSSTFDALLRRKGLDGDTSDQEKLDNAKRLKRMKDRMREMSQWCEQVLLEGEEDIDEQNHGSKNENEKVPALPRPLSRASTAPSSTFDTVLRKKGFNSASDQDNLHRAKRSKRMKECTREMSRWCGQVICEDEEYCGCEEDNIYTCKDHVLKNETEEVAASGWHEKAGECVAIQFKCPCEKVYELLLSENHIYYKLMPFQQEEAENEAEEKISVERSENWVVVMTKCPCGKGYRVLLSGKDCFYKLID